MPEISTRPFDIIVFDLGGVLVELGGLPRMLELLSHRLTVEELWTRWLTSPGAIVEGRLGVTQIRAQFMEEEGEGCG